jgi:hypothetical protein
VYRLSKKQKKYILNNTLTKLSIPAIYVQLNNCDSINLIRYTMKNDMDDTMFVEFNMFDILYNNINTMFVKLNLFDVLYNRDIHV